MQKHWFIFFTIISYLFFAVYYTGIDQSVLHCTTTVNAVGDSTAGSIWRNTFVSDTPVGGYSHVTNYPNGDNLSSPIDAIVMGQSLVVWSASKVFGPICGYNVTNIIGFVTAALVMFGFIYSLTKGRRWIAWLAGYAVAFTPFFQIKPMVHLGYGFQALLIGVVWALFSLIKTRKISRAILLAVLMAVCVYFDPYFTLLSMTIIGPLLCVWLILQCVRLKKKSLAKTDFLQQAKMLGVSIGVFAVMMAPLAYIVVTQSSEIKNATAGTRADVRGEAKVYSNVPSEYFLPFYDSPLFDLLGSYKKETRDALFTFADGNITEDSVGLSYVMVGTIILAGLAIFWERLHKRRQKMGVWFAYDAKLVVIGMAAVGVAGVLLALPPVHFLGIPTPSYILLKYVSIWRVISREYVVVNLATVVLFAMALVYFARTVPLKKVAKAVVIAVLFTGIFVQYYTYGPFQGLTTAKFNFESQASQGYYWLRDHQDVQRIAEYPIEKPTEANSHVFYMSMQLVHKKPLLNSALTNGPDEPIRSTIKNLADPQTVPVLHALGIDTVVVHGVSAAEVEAIPYLSVVYSGEHGPFAPGSPAIKTKSMVIAKIDGDVPVTQTSLQFLTTNAANYDIFKSAVDWQYEVPSRTKIGERLLPLQSGDSGVDHQVCFAIKMSVAGDASTITIGDKAIVDATDSYQDVTFFANTSQTLPIESANGHNMQMTRIGCR